MSRIARAVAFTLALMGLAAVVAPLQADEGHCARPVVGVESPPAHPSGHAMLAPSDDSLLPEQGCPSCPAPSCGAMHGCSVTAQASPEFVVARATLLPRYRSSVSATDVVPASVSHAPPTPPPLVVLSPA
jgi:hypothetical protein